MKYVFDKKSSEVVEKPERNVAKIDRLPFTFDFSEVMRMIELGKEMARDWRAEEKSAEDNYGRSAH